MKFVKLILIFAFALALYWLRDATAINHYSSNFRSTLHNSIKRTRDIPQDITINIKMEVSNHIQTHTHTFNDGGYQIYVNVSGQTDILRSGSIKQIYGEVHCNVFSEDRGLTGTIDIELTKTALGGKSDDDLQEEFRQEIINDIIENLATV